MKAKPKRRMRKPTRRRPYKSTDQADVLSATLGRDIVVPQMWQPHDMKRVETRQLVMRMAQWVHLCITLNSRTAASIQPRLFVVGNKQQVQKMSWHRPKALDLKTKAYLKGNARLRPGNAAMKRLAGNVDDLTEVFEHPALDVLDNVNDWEEGFGYRESIYADLDMAGRHFTNIIAPGPEQPPVALWRMLPHLMKVIPSPTEFVSHFEYGRGNQSKRFEREDVFWVKLHDPEDPWGGLGPLEAFIQTIDASFTMLAFQRWLFNRGGTPDVIITVKNGATVDQQNQIRSNWRRMYGNMGNREESLAIISGDAVVQNLSQKPQEMQFRDSRMDVRDEICAAFGVPKSMITSDDVNRANAEASNPLHITNKIWPMVTRVEDAINQRLLPLWSDRLVLIHENPLREDQTIVIQQRESKLKSGWTVNEIRLCEGEEPLDDEMADKAMIATGIVPLENISEAGLPPPAPVIGPEGIGGTDGKPQDDPEPQEDKSDGSVSPGSPPADALAVILKELEAIRARVSQVWQIELPKHGAPHPCTHNQSAELAKWWETGFVDRVTSVSAFTDIYVACLEKAIDPQEPLDEGSIPGFTKRLEAAMRAQVNTLIAGLTKADRPGEPDRPDRGMVDQAILNMRKHTGAIKTAVRPFIQRSLQIGGDFGWDRLKAQLGKTAKADKPKPMKPMLGTGFDVSNPAVQEFVEQYSIRLTDQINGTTIARAKDVLDGALSRGETIPQMIERVKEWAGEVGDVTRGMGARAENIARTESARAYVEGQQEAWKQSGVVTGKKVLLAPDACEICEAIAEQYASKTIALDQAFYRVGEKVPLKNGGSFDVDYSDLNGPPFHPQCRCDLIAVLEGE